jgi:hypothetical protein
VADLDLRSSRSGRILGGVTGLIVVPDDRLPSSAVLVLSGSNGRVEEQRVRLLAKYGAAAAASLRWFGGPVKRPSTTRPAVHRFAASLGRDDLDR